MSLAARYGLSTWKTLFDHPDNQPLKDASRHPGVLLPGDRVSIPDKDDRSAEAATGKLHTFKVKLPQALVRIVLKDHEGRALSGKRYLLVVGDVEREGATGEDGLVEQRIPAEAREGDLTVFFDEEDEENRMTFSLQFGHLDPIEHLRGVQARLDHLGFMCPVTGQLDDHTRAALAAFQKKHGIEVTQTPDDRTRAKLVELHENL